MSNASEKTVHVKQHGDGIVSVALRSGQRLNVFTVDMLVSLESVITELELSESQPRVVIFTGEPTTFSAGLAITDTIKLSREDFVDFVRLEYELIRRIEQLPLITIAAIAGPCIGNAAEFALACDYRFSAPKLRFGLPEVAIAFMAPAQRITQYLLPAQAKKMLLESRLLSAEESLELGLVDEIADDPFTRGLEKAREMAALSPVAIALTKRNLYEISNRAAHRDAEEMANAVESFDAGDAHVAMRAFLDRQTPNFA